jgi:hypothetical protein
MDPRHVRCQCRTVFRARSSGSRIPVRWPSAAHGARRFRDPCDADRQLTRRRARIVDSARALAELEARVRERSTQRVAVSRRAGTVRAKRGRRPEEEAHVSWQAAPMEPGTSSLARRKQHACVMVVATGCKQRARVRWLRRARVRHAHGLRWRHERRSSHERLSCRERSDHRW